MSVCAKNGKNPLCIPDDSPILQNRTYSFGLPLHEKRRRPLNLSYCQCAVEKIKGVRGLIKGVRAIFPLIQLLSVWLGVSIKLI